MEKLLSPDPTVVDSVRPDEYFFRIYIEMETGHPSLSEIVNGGMWIGVAARKGAEGENTLFCHQVTWIPIYDGTVIYNAYRIG